MELLLDKPCGGYESETGGILPRPFLLLLELTRLPFPPGDSVSTRSPRHDRPQRLQDLRRQRGFPQYQWHLWVAGIQLDRDSERDIRSDNSVVQGNRAHDSGTGFLIGGTNVLVTNNQVQNADLGVVFLPANGKYRSNITIDVGTPYTGGTDAGDND